MPVDATFELRYVPHDREQRRAPSVKMAEDDLTTAFYREGSLDVIELLREQFQLALPMKPLCAEACRGLCPECGANLNRTECGCTPQWEDPRLAPLKGLLASATGTDQLKVTRRRRDPGEINRRTETCRIRNGGIRRPAPPSAAPTTPCKPVPVGTCPQCQEAKAPHQVCPNCGYYKGRQVKAVEET